MDYHFSCGEQEEEHVTMSPAGGGVRGLAFVVLKNMSTVYYICYVHNRKYKKLYKILVGQNCRKSEKYFYVRWVWKFHMHIYVVEKHSLLKLLEIFNYLTKRLEPSPYFTFLYHKTVVRHNPDRLALLSGRGPGGQTPPHSDFSTETHTCFPIWCLIFFHYS